jgi:hypothetical protein
MNEEEARNWEPTIRYYALSTRVLAVATTRIEGAWRAFVDVVPGYNHSEECRGVLDLGSVLEEKVARVLFPEFEDLPYAY